MLSVKLVLAILFKSDSKHSLYVRYLAHQSCKKLRPDFELVLGIDKILMDIIIMRHRHGFGSYTAAMQVLRTKRVDYCGVNRHLEKAIDQLIYDVCVAQCLNKYGERYEIDNMEDRNIITDVFFEVLSEEYWRYIK